MTLYLIIATLVTMRILGIDPGIAITGFGVIDIIGHKLVPVSFGAITTPSNLSVGERLVMIESNLVTIIDNYAPNVCAMEEVFFSKNVKTAITVSHARGVMVFCMQRAGIPVFNYTPTAVKSAILGFGGAEKKQVQFMTKELLKLDRVPKPDDVADALAIAICHHHSHSLQSKI